MFYHDQNQLTKSSQNYLTIMTSQVKSISIGISDTTSCIYSVLDWHQNPHYRPLLIGLFSYSSEHVTRSSLWSLNVRYKCWNAQNAKCSLAPQHWVKTARFSSTCPHVIRHVALAKIRHAAVPLFLSFRGLFWRTACASWRAQFRDKEPRHTKFCTQQGFC